MAGMMRLIGNTRGTSRIKVIVTLAIIAAIAYCAIKFIPPFVGYLKVKNAAYDTMNSVGDKGDDKILERFLRMTRDIKPGPTQENVTVERNESEPATLVVDYSVNVVLIKGKIEKLLKFRVEEKAKK